MRPLRKSTREPFSEIRRWAGGNAEQTAGLVFIDTPGLSVAGSIKDEVLCHVLSKKNQQIIVELLRQDELDIIIHLVLNPRQSDFSDLWKAVVEQCSPDELSDLGDRLILAINGFNLYFTDPNLIRKWSDPESSRREGDIFAVTLEDNILKKMSERGTIRPVRPVSLTARRLSNTPMATTASSRKIQGQDGVLVQAGAPCYQTLERLGLVESLRENVEALCNADDRGQGYLVRQLLEVIRENGPRLLVRKHLIRSMLLASIRKIRETLLRSYDENGHLNSQVVQDAIRQCLGAVKEHDLATIETFAATNLDRLVEQTVQFPAVGHRAADVRGHSTTRPAWASEAFNQVGKLVFNALKEQPGVSPQSSAIFRRFFEERLNTWRVAWGYEATRLPAPTQQHPTPGHLVRYSLKIHVREMLCRLLPDSADISLQNIVQEPGDQETIHKVQNQLNDILKKAEAICQHEGMPI